ncbi:hypothetical protein predicted by Glimmer/Critica (plasmid) [Sinorhizobium fredii HH103]|uniref:Uncharacterized protein n=1 Tax=Sinorhizobium fredii (strain HH103) TaxID=1117943 RepID=G9AIJ2_SINF1|nr:hypothetical protein predicted by Glimmer/Critica [Sinorhizobium fredii HH103]
MPVQLGILGPIREKRDERRESDFVPKSEAA